MMEETRKKGEIASVIPHPFGYAQGRGYAVMTIYVKLLIYNMLQ